MWIMRLFRNANKRQTHTKPIRQCTARNSNYPPLKWSKRVISRKKFMSIYWNEKKISFWGIISKLFLINFNRQQNLFGNRSSSNACRRRNLNMERIRETNNMPKKIALCPARRSHLWCLAFIWLWLVSSPSCVRGKRKSRVYRQSIIIHIFKWK